MRFQAYSNIGTREYARKLASENLLKEAIEEARKIPQTSQRYQEAQKISQSGQKFRDLPTFV